MKGEVSSSGEPVSSGISGDVPTAKDERRGKGISPSSNDSTNLPSRGDCLLAPRTPNSEMTDSFALIPSFEVDLASW